jgi:hypothetical protein
MTLSGGRNVSVLSRSLCSCGTSGIEGCFGGLLSAEILKHTQLYRVTLTIRITRGST